MLIAAIEPTVNNSTANLSDSATDFSQNFINSLVIIGQVSLVVIACLVFLVISVFLIRKLTLMLSYYKRLSKFAFIEIMVPESTYKKSQEDGTAKKDDKETIAVCEQLFRSINTYAQKPFKDYFTGGTSYSFEMVCKNGKINFWIGGPIDDLKAIEKQVTALFPRSMINYLDKPEITSENSFCYAQEYTTQNLEFLPFRTYKNIESDPLNVIANALGTANDNDSFCLQLLLTPVASSWQKKPRKFALKIQQGFSPDEVFNKKSFNLPSQIEKFIRFVLDKEKNEKQDTTDHDGKRKIDDTGSKQAISLTPQQQEIIKKLEEKASLPGFKFNLRVMACCQNEDDAINLVDNFYPSLQSFDIRPFNNFQKTKSSVKQVIDQFLARSANYKTQKIINTEEANSIWHLPTHLSTNSAINYLSSFKPSLPINTVGEGSTNVYVGMGKSGTVQKKIYLTQEDRFRHIYALGGSGSGKSVFMTNLVLQDIKIGNGVCVVDPHGETVDDILLRIPKERIDDVVIFSPSMVDKPLGLNMLEYDPLKPAQRTVVIDTLFQIWDKLYDLKATGGPMFEQYMKNSMKLVMSHPQSGNTLLEIPKVLADDNYRAFKLAMCKEQDVYDFWMKEAQKAGGEASLENMVPYITSKLAPFVQNDFIRPMIGQAKSAINFRQAMDNKKIILVKLEKGLIGETSGYLLGMIIIGQILLAGMGRNDGLKYNMDGTTTEILPHERTPFFVYIDEMQNFLFDAIPKALEEIRKYKVGFCLAHQFIKQVVSKGDERIKDSIMANTGSKFIFRCGADDAEYLAKEFEPTLTAQDLMNPERFTANCRVLINGEKTKPFCIAPEALSSEISKDLKKELIRLTQEKYGRSLFDIKADIIDRQEKFLF
jgi:TraM recognition site of TraD and TraG/Type IV secretory system Conjugative DNA transfer